jgi:hypothetical protein
MTYQTALVNFETFFIPDDQKLQVIVDDINQAVNQGADTIIGLMLADGFLYYDARAKTLIEQVQDRCNQLSVRLLLLPGMIDHADISSEIISGFDYNIHITYNSYVDRLDILHRWNSSAEKFLFLGGVPSRPNRIGLFNRYYCAGMLDKSVYSFFKPWIDEHANWCRQHLQTYSDNEYAKLLSMAKGIDTLYESNNRFGLDDYDYDNGWFSDPAWIDPGIYTDTLFSVVSEGQPIDNRLDSRFLTEKTLRVFAQQHPYILAANPTMANYIKSLGFKLFDEYMQYPDYLSEEDENLRLDLVVENTKQFLTAYKNNIDSIQADVEHNYQQFLKIGEENQSKLNLIQNRYNVTPADMDKWFNKKGFSHLIRRHNENINT